MKLHLTLSAVLPVALAAAACTGKVLPGEDDPANPPGVGPNPTPTNPSPTNPGGKADPNAAGLMPLRRLTIREYNNTVRDLLGDSTAPGQQFPDDRDETFPFRRANAIAVQDAKLIRAAAESLAAAAVRNLGAVLPCDPAAAGEPACASQFVTSFGLRAFRRPLTAAESSRLMGLFTSARNTLKLGFAEAIGLVLEGMLQAPAFLYHWEVPAAAPIREGAVVRLGHYEMASRLSYFLWGSMPDRDLFAAAAAGHLGTPAEVQGQARRLLGDARAKDTVAAFFADWLQVDALEEKAAKDPKVYPEFDAGLKAAMAAETRAFVESVVFDGDGRWGTMLGASFSFVNQALAGVYGMAQVTGSNLRRAELDATQRAGFLTQPSFLTLTGAADGSHPVRRGKAIYEKLLCRTLPPPPANVPPAKPASAGGTTRERFAEHDGNDCARACHSLIDPLGFAFENYDGIGKYRTMDNGKNVDASGEVTLDGAPRRFNDAVELSALLAGSAETRRCFATQWVRFALSRNESSADAASVELAAASFLAPESTVRELMVAVATMRSFRYRIPSPGEVLQ
jgi:hypothetical protein